MSANGIYKMDNLSKLKSVIQYHTGITSPGDRNVKVLLVPNSIQFWSKGTESIGEPPPIEELLKVRPESEKNLDMLDNQRRRALFTRFDGAPLSARSEAFQARIAELFVSSLLSQDSFAENTEIDSQDNRLRIARLILENNESLQNFLGNPSAYLAEIEETLDVVLSDEEWEQFEHAGNNKPAIYSLFDYAELGESAGDGDTYILVGSAADTNVPAIETMLWLQQSLTDFMEHFKFLPAYGSYITEAALRHRVILGPGISERERQYIINNVFDVHDCRKGQPISSLELE